MKRSVQKRCVEKKDKQKFDRIKKTADESNKCASHKKSPNAEYRTEF